MDKGPSTPVPEVVSAEKEVEHLVPVLEPFLLRGTF